MAYGIRCIWLPLISVDGRWNERPRYKWSRLPSITDMQQSTGDGEGWRVDNELTE